MRRVPPACARCVVWELGYTFIELDLPACARERERKRERERERARTREPHAARRQGTVLLVVKDQPFAAWAMLQTLMYVQALLMLLLPPLSGAVSKPRLRGIFVDLTPTTMGWTAAEWTTDLRSMATVGIKFLVIHHSAVGDANISATCPAGTYEAYFELNSTDCIRVGSGGTLAAVLQAAKVVGLRVHLGLAEQEMLGPIVDGVRRNPLYGRYANTTAIAHFQEVQATLARGLWNQFGSTGVVDGFYTVLEEPQNFASSLPDWERLALYYFQPLANYIKHSLAPMGRYYPSELLVWSSPDAVGNYSRYHRADMLGPRLYGDLWEQMFLLAPELDHIALQDSQGERGQNSLADTAEFLGNCSAAGLRQNRSTWSNVELFQVWPPSCEWSKVAGHCRGRAPAPMDRIITQLATASAVLDSASDTKEAVVIAWEWTTCLSPNGGSGKANISRLAAENYRAYLSYIQTPASNDASHASVANTATRSVPPCVASDWVSLSSCIAGLTSSANRFIEMTQIIDVPLSSAAVAISTSGATLFSTSGGGLRRKQVDLSHGGMISVQNCENVSLIGLTFVDELSTRARGLSDYKHCNPPNATGGGGAQLSLSNAKYTTVTGCTFLNSSSFNVAVSRSNFTLFRDNILSGCCMFGLWSPFYSTQTHMYMLNNNISDINSNAFLISIVDSLIQGNTLSRTHSATVFGHDSGGQGALNNGSARVIISGNLIVNGSVTAGDVAQKTHGFEFSNGPSGVIDVLVQGNAM